MKECCGCLRNKSKRKHFLGGDVKIGDEVVNNDDVCGKVIGLIYTEEGFSGIRVCYEKYGTLCSTYQDNDYKFFKRIGDWVNKDWD